MKILFIFLALILLFFFSYTFYCLYTPISIPEKIIEIKHGSSARMITEELFQEQIIKYPNLFYNFVRITGESKSLKYGKYLFKGNYSILSVIKVIKNGRIHLKKITIPEGLTIKKTCRLLSKKGIGNNQILMKLCNDPVFSSQLTGMKVTNLEGFLYPETYFFPDEVSEEFIIKHLVKQFLTEVDTLRQKTSCCDLNFYQVLILASIVEREAQRRSEKPLIASVYLNRIKNGGYKLQADPTVAYALEQRGKKREKIFFKDLLIDSPYNTYKHFGLPPTPICSPSANTIRAVYYPQKSNKFYFFADKKGGHIFSRTFKEHVSKQKSRITNE